MGKKLPTIEEVLEEYAKRYSPEVADVGAPSKRWDNPKPAPKKKKKVRKKLPEKQQWIKDKPMTVPYYKGWGEG